MQTGSLKSLLRVGLLILDSDLNIQHHLHRFAQLLEQQQHHKHLPGGELKRNHGLQGDMLYRTS